MGDLAYLSEIASDEIASLKSYAFGELGIPVDVFNQFGQSGYWLAAGVTNEDIDFAKHLTSFYRLLDSAPDTPADCILYTSIACTAIMLSLAVGLDNDAPQDLVYVLMAASEYKATAMVSFRNRGGVEAKAELARQKKMRSENGRSGGKARGKKHAPVKDWVRDMAKKYRSLNRSDAELSRRLFKEMPFDLLARSEDPQRLIYRTLREFTRTNTS